MTDAPAAAERVQLRMSAAGIDMHLTVVALERPEAMPQ